MTPTKFNGAYSRDLEAGDNPNCGALPRVVCLDKDTPGIAVVLSCWEPSDEELEAIVRDRKVYIGVCAPLHRPTQPPIYCAGVNPIDIGQFIPVPEEDLKYLGGQDRPIL
jgi:hypothetical protein